MSWYAIVHLCMPLVIGEPATCFQVQSNEIVSEQKCVEEILPVTPGYMMAVYPGAVIEDWYCEKK